MTLTKYPSRVTIQQFWSSVKACIFDTLTNYCKTKLYPFILELSWRRMQPESSVFKCLTSFSVFAFTMFINNNKITVIDTGNVHETKLTAWFIRIPIKNILFAPLLLTQVIAIHICSKKVIFITGTKIILFIQACGEVLKLRKEKGLKMCSEPTTHTRLRIILFFFILSKNILHILRYSFSDIPSCRCCACKAYLSDAVLL